jgi:hypothetical protein
MDDDLFNILNKSFPTESQHLNIIDYDGFERFENNDSYIFTVPFTKEITREDIRIIANPHWVDYIVLDDMYTFLLADNIIPEKTIATLRNSVLDITLIKNKQKGAILHEDVEVKID